MSFSSEILQVISNLLLNALDALPVEGARLRVGVRTGRHGVNITVSDNGSWNLRRYFDAPIHAVCDNKV